jgi:ergothioneine biosynthesis protein EgtB
MVMFSVAAIDTTAAIDWYRRNRTRSEAMFDLIDPAAYYSRPIALRNPVVFYEGHLPAFSVIAFLRRELGLPPVDARLEKLFERGIDPDTEVAAVPRSGASTVWPTRDEVRAFAGACDEAVISAIASLPSAALPLEGLYTALEHEAMHQETLLYMWHRLPFSEKRRPTTYTPRTEGATPAQEWIEIPGGRVTLGVDRAAVPFGWDNEFPATTAGVDAFAIERHDVTNARFLEFIDAGGYTDARWWRPEDWSWSQTEGITHPLFWERRDSSWYWRGMFDLIPLPLAWPVYVSHAEAAAFARWRGARLPTEGEFQRAAFGTRSARENRHPWGEGEPQSTHGVFDFSSWDPEPAGTHPAGASGWGVEDLVGNGWIWTGTPFAPFPGFRAMASYPEYSADFFDGEHFVMKGASPATARELLRPTFRNWFRPRYPYVYAKFRCVRPAHEVTKG